MPELAVLHDPQTGGWLRFAEPVETIEIRTPGLLLPALRRIEERVEKDRLYAAGFVSYEAAPACDDALPALTDDDFPLARFGLFAAVESIDLPAPDSPPVLPAWRPMETANGFAARVEAIKAAIARGETYQVNLTFPLIAPFPYDPWNFFLQLVHGQQAGAAGYLEAGRWAVCSASPELFFTRNGDILRMRPMKGTAPRGRTLAEDRENAARLLGSAKDRAENVMILDMVRNDLGRLAPPGEVRVEAICALEKYPTVWQLTSTAAARSEVPLDEVFRALFPCASITGAPKARTMQIIAAAEARPRRLYTGTFGWLAPGRRAHFSVAIRTALVDRCEQLASYGVGAGITWGSECEAEYRECLDKAAILARPRSRFDLLETLRWTPGRGYFLLEEHLARLQESAAYFDFPCRPEEVRAYLGELATGFPRSALRVRLLLGANGRIDASWTAAPAPAGVLRLGLAERPVDRRDPLLYHKTTQRGLYERALAEAGDVDEVVLWNERGEATECCNANLVVEKDGRLVTPPLTSGLLAGTYRAFLLRCGVIAEETVSLEDLHASPRIFLVNALRKWRRARMA